MKPYESVINAYLAERKGLGHMKGQSRAQELGSLESITETYEQMSSLSPAAKAFFQGQSRMAKMGRMSAETYAEITRKVPGIEWEHVATIPPDLWMLLNKKDPNLLEDTERFEKFLKSDAAAGIRVQKDLQRGKGNVGIRPSR